MTTVYEVLRTDAEEMPRWLQDYKPRTPVDRRMLLSSRTVYYPGSGFDGHAVKVFGSTHAAHVFVYVDFSSAHTQTLILDMLNAQDTGFRGYHVLSSMELEDQSAQAGFGMVAVLERDEDRDDSHGPSRLAILFLHADGFAAYEALFCQGNGVPAPFAILLQDHGFGGNDDQRFGGGGLLERIARGAEVLSTWLLVAENTRLWAGYSPLPDVVGDPGGHHLHLRFLCRRR